MALSRMYLAGVVETSALLPDLLGEGEVVAGEGAFILDAVCVELWVKGMGGARRWKDLEAVVHGVERGADREDADDDADQMSAACCFQGVAPMR